MITGRQIREARLMLGWSDETLCKRADIDGSTMTRAEGVEGTPSITLGQGARIQKAFEAAGVRFGANVAIMRPTTGS